MNIHWIIILLLMLLLILLIASSECLLYSSDNPTLLQISPASYLLLHLAQSHQQQQLALPQLIIWNPWSLDSLESAKPRTTRQSYVMLITMLRRKLRQRLRSISSPQRFIKMIAQRIRCRNRQVILGSRNKRQAQQQLLVHSQRNSKLN